MDESGVIRLESAEATFQREVIEEVKEDDKKKKDAPDFDKGTLDALKDKFKDFFNGDGDNEEEARKVLEELANAKKEEEEKKSGDEEEKTGDDEKKAEEEPKAEEEEKKEEEEKPEEAKAEEAKEGEEKKEEEK